MVFILMTACYALVVGRILGELIRCPLVFCTFWLLAMICALIHNWVVFMSSAMGKLLHLLSFPASWLYSDTLLLVVNGCSYPLGFAPCLFLCLQVLVCLYDTILLRAVGYRQYQVFSFRGHFLAPIRRRQFRMSKKLSADFKIIPNPWCLPTMSYSN